jgi:hypothetical protein
MGIKVDSMHGTRGTRIDNQVDLREASCRATFWIRVLLLLILANALFVGNANLEFAEKEGKIRLKQIC